ncbi:MAG: response regulator transcription factor [Anaerolineales bacterium]|nr:response regulator transcription factor [Anaerolineales bacterium]
MVNAKVLLLESERTNAPSFAPALEKRGYQVAIEHSAQTAVKHLHTVEPDLVVLDAASLKTSGARICRLLRASLNGTPIVLVADKRNPPDANCGASVVLTTPFTPRKLLNTVARLLPADEGTSLQVGPIKLNLGQKRIKCGDREEKVTPKQAKLLEMFLRAPGQLLSRKAIIKHVWDTDYVGDTRTLDVHISWLRGVIEPNPRKPRYLKTVRGQGYRLDVPPSA